MILSWDVNVVAGIGLLIVIGVQIVGIIVFLVKTNSKAKSAHEMAQKAQDRADDAHEKIAIHQSALSVFREEVARDYIDRVDLDKMEQRLTAAINRLGDRIDNAGKK